MRIGSDTVEAWQAIWLTAWPGAEAARPALKSDRKGVQVIEGRSGDVVSFDVRMLPGIQWHDLVRNAGIEDINLLGKTYHAVKISHCREGCEGYIYRPVSTRAIAFKFCRTGRGGV